MATEQKRCYILNTKGKKRVQEIRDQLNQMLLLLGPLKLGLRIVLLDLPLEVIVYLDKRDFRGVIKAKPCRGHRAHGKNWR